MLQEDAARKDEDIDTYWWACEKDGYRVGHW